MDGLRRLPGGLAATPERVPVGAVLAADSPRVAGATLSTSGCWLNSTTTCRRS